MLPPCFRLAERVFPLVRQEAAHRMAAAGHTQSEIGGRLGVSQAMVSKYLKAGRPSLREEDEWIVHQMAQEIAQDTAVAETQRPEEANPWCRTLASTTGEHQEDRRRIVSSLSTLLTRLQELEVSDLLPAVGMNLAGAPPAARMPDDVAAFPGRLAYVKGTLRAHAPPEFGASNHLAHLLIQAQRTSPAVRLAVNLAGTPPVLKALKAAREHIIEADGEHRDEAGVARFDAPRSAFALVDPGGFGIEPAVYLLDEDANRLADRVARLAKRIHQRRG